MRKIALLLAFLLAAGSASVFAETAISTEFSIEGEASLRFALDLDTGGYGFTNSSSADIELLFLDEASYTNDPGEGWRGVISLSDISIEVGNAAGGSVTAVTGLNNTEFLLLDDATAADVVDLNGKTVKDDTTADEATLLEKATLDSDIKVTDPTVTAYITNDIVTVKLGSPSNSPTQVSPIETDKVADDDYIAMGWDGDNDIGTDLSEYGGVTVGLDVGPATIEVGLSTLYNEDSKLDGEFLGSDDQEWQLSALVIADLDPISVTFGLAQDLGDQIDGGTVIGSNVAATFGPLGVSVGADLDTNAEFFEFGGGIDVAVVDGVDVGVDFIYSDNPLVGFDAAVDVDLAIIDGLDIGVDVGIYDLVGVEDGDDYLTDDAADIAISADVAFDVAALGGTITTAVGVDYDIIALGDDTAEIPGVSASLTLADAIPNTAFALAFVDTDLGDLDVFGKSPTSVVSFTTTVTY